mmetsp:Transcript_23861/g.49269  ORF Transcript_23861/g.49269 Transcript_23861/m.49269 type:complete len:525 (-) Transcript_23861:1019-2593(-)
MQQLMFGWVQWMMNQFKPVDVNDTEGKKTFRWSIATMLQYLSQFVCEVEDMSEEIKEHPVIRDRINDRRGAWLTEMRSMLESRAKTWAYKNGVQVYNETPSARLSTVTNMADYLLGVNTHKGLYNRFRLICNYQAVHRGGEYANMSWLFFSFNEEEGSIVGDKRETKTGNEWDVPFFVSEDYSHCFFHSLAGYLMTQFASDAYQGTDPLGIADEMVFPSMYNAPTGRAAREIGDIFKECYNAKVPGVTKDMVATSLRCGGTDDLALNPSIDILDNIARGGWEVAEVRIFAYLGRLERITKSGRVLAGWKNGNINISYTKPCFIDDSNEATVNEICKELFRTPKIQQWEEENFLHLKRVLLARVLAADEEYVKDFGHDGIMHRNLVEKARQCGVGEATLRDWGAKVRQRFATENRAAEMEVNGTTVAERVQNRQEVLIDEVLHLKKQVETAVGAMGMFEQNVSHKVEGVEARLKALEVCVNVLLIVFSFALTLAFVLALIIAVAFVLIIVPLARSQINRTRLTFA